MAFLSKVRTKILMLLVMTGQWWLATAAHAQVYGSGPYGSQTYGGFSVGPFVLPITGRNLLLMVVSVLVCAAGLATFLIVRSRHKRRLSQQSPQTPPTPPASTPAPPQTPPQ